MKSTKRRPSAGRADRTRAEIDAYEFTIRAALSLEEIFGAAIGAQARQGPKMQTSAGKTVTPDMTFEVPSGRFAGYRAVNEIKFRYPQRGRPFCKLAKQLQQYDDIVSGWLYPVTGGGPGKPDYDLMLTVPTDHASDYVANLCRDLHNSGVPIAKEICILSFGRDSRSTDDRLHAEIVHGLLSNSKINGRLSGDETLQTYALLADLNAVKFYDSDPPITYMMSILWSHVFIKMIHGKKLDAVLKGRTVKITAKVQRTHKLVSKFAPPSNPRCIKTSWVILALDEFVRVKLAKKVGDEEYEIYYRRGGKFVLDWLIGLVHNLHGRADRRAGDGDDEPLDPFFDRRGG